jgi:hypothetical protein
VQIISGLAKDAISGLLVNTARPNKVASSSKRTAFYLEQWGHPVIAEIADSAFQTWL